MGYPLLYLEVCEPQTDLDVYGAHTEWANCKSGLNGEYESTYEHQDLRRWIREPSGNSGGAPEWALSVRNPKKGVGRSGMDGAWKRQFDVVYNQMKLRSYARPRPIFLRLDEIRLDRC